MKVEESSAEYDMFLEGLDDIPSMMEMVKTAPASPRRFRGPPNISHGVDDTLKGQCKNDKRTYAEHSKKLLRQASWVLDKYSSADSPHKARTRPQRPPSEVAQVVSRHMSEDKDGGIFRNLDPYQSGRISHDDFLNVMSTKNTGLTRSEMKDMLNELDKDRNGLSNYSTVYSDLSTIKPAKDEDCADSYTKAYEESKRNETTSYSQKFEHELAKKADPVPEKDTPSADPPKYDGIQQFFDYQAKREREKQIISEKRAMNEQRYGDAFDYATLIDKPSNNFAPHISIKAKDGVERYCRGSGNIPNYKTPACINDIIFNRFAVGRSGERAAEVFHSDDVIGTVDIDEVEGISNDELSYSKAFEAKKSEEFNKARSSSPHPHRHHKTFAPLPTKKVIGAADPVERMYKGNPSTFRNRVSRGFHNSFIFDHRIPTRLRRSHSAPPEKRRPTGKRMLKPENNDRETVGSLFEYLSKAHDETSVSCKNERKNSSNSSVRSRDSVKGDSRVANANAGEVERKKIADFVAAPPFAQKKKTPVSDPRALKKSMNTLVSQLNNHSKIKILNHKMKKIDVSNSGYVNKSEFATALSELGVNISPSQVTALYENNARSNVGLDVKSNTSLKLSSHQRGVNVQDFIQKIRARASANTAQEKSKQQGVHAPTPLEREDSRVWKKVVEALSEDNKGGKKIIADFFRDAQVNHQNEVHADQLFNELNYIGAKLGEMEFRNMMSNIKRKPNGHVDVDDFTQEYHKRSVECREYDKRAALMPSLEHDAPSDGLSEQARRLRQVFKTQKKHFSKKQGEETLNGPVSKKAGFEERLNNPVLGETKSYERGHVPSCLTMSDSREFRKERLNWSKLSRKFLNHKDKLLSAFGGEDGINAPLTEGVMKDKLYEAGVLLGNDDLMILKSFTETSTAHEGDQNLTFGKICSSMGLNVECDSRRRVTLSSSADFEHDCGVFASSSESLLSQPSFRSTMLTTTSLDDKFIKGNRKKRFDDSTGKPMTGAPQPVKASEFWKFDHIPEIKKMPAKLLSYHQRLNLPEESLDSSSRGFTTLRKIKEERKRSSSAPPRYTTLDRSFKETTNARTHMWQRSKLDASNRVEPSRFAAAPLAEYIAMKNQQKQDGMNEDSNAPLRTSDLDVSANTERDGV